MTTPSDPNQPEQGYQSGLPSFPSAPPPSDYDQQQPVQAGPVPNTITAAFWCFMLTAVIALVYGLLYLGAKQAIVDALHTANTNGTLTDAQIETTANVTLGVLVVVFVILAALYAFFGFKLRAGRNWARIVLTIMVVLYVIAMVSARGGTAVGYIGVLAGVVGVVLSYMPASRDYFTAIKASQYRR